VKLVSKFAGFRFNLYRYTLVVMLVTISTAAIALAITAHDWGQ
jgi:hypothetical protein